MPTENVFMDIPAVRDMGKRFETIGETLEMVSTILENLMTVLKVTAFVGLVGGAAVANYLEQFKPIIDKLAEKCREMSQDLEKSATAYENNDAATSRYF